MSSALLNGADAETSVAQAAALSNSSKYRAYVAAVDKALKAFETSNEWADLISALTKLSRVFHANAKFNFDIPKPVIVAKRLSQCLHPALPHGVHLKALETYRQLFDILGPKYLPRLLYLFAVGLFPLMDFCGIKVKSELLSIFEQYLLPLGVRIKPALPGFLTAVLLGLEEGTEFFNRSLTLLNNLKDGVGAEAFFSSLWEAALGSPSVRLPALIFVNNCFDKRKTMEDQIFIMGDHVDHMIVALCAIADDTGSTLVQRYLLDFLSAAFPLNSDYLVREDFVQLLRRCVFVLLRRDMSLNRRLHHWLLNRSGDSSAASQSLGTEDEVDTTFFKTYSLPLIKKAIEEYLKLDIVEVPHKKDIHDSTKDHQIQFTEVRVCRLLLYFLDRPELGNLILEETLFMVMNEASKYKLAMEGSVGKGFNVAKRVEEFDKTFNLLLNSLDAGYIWNHIKCRFESLMNGDDEDHEEKISNYLDPELITNESWSLKEELRRQRVVELDAFPKILTYCVQTVELASHGDIRRVHLPNLCTKVLSILIQKDLGDIDCDFLHRLLPAVRAMLCEVQHYAVALEEGGFFLSHKRSAEKAVSPSKSQKNKQRSSIPTDNLAIELCFETCQKFFAEICSWFCEDRNAERYEVFRSACDLLKECVDFPFSCFNGFQKNGYRQGFNKPMNYERFPEWVSGVCSLISFCASKFYERNRRRLSGTTVFVDEKDDLLFDRNEFLGCAEAIKLLIYIHVRSNEYAKHQLSRVENEEKFNFRDSRRNDTIHLTVPFMSLSCFKKISADGVFEEATKYVWLLLGSERAAKCHNTAAYVLMLLHARQIEEASSEVEELILRDLTTNSKVMNANAAKKFRRLWVLSRSGHIDELFKGLPAKPFNRVIMVFLGILASDITSYENTELHDVASAWFAELAKRNDLPRILQMLSVMLLNPTTARISIQYLSMHNRLNKDQLLGIPPGICTITLLSDDGRHFLYHLCEDVSNPLANPTCRSSEALTFLQQARYSQSTPYWLNDLRGRLLQLGDSESSVNIGVVPASVKAHRRTVSDIPIFDGDNESLVSIESGELAVVDTVNFLIDYICEMENFGVFEGEVKQEKVIIPDKETEIPEEERPSISSGVIKSSDFMKSTSDRHSTEPSEFSTEASAAENFKRLKGHRRQDSLQESIFTMTAQELKLFDSSDMPRLNAAGDDKQPLCHELHAHMLLYTESGHAVDLARAEKVLRMIIALMRLQGTCVPSHLMTSCMVSSGTASLSTYSNCIGGNQIVDLMYRHFRAIAGQDFWVGNDGDGYESAGEVSRNRHYAFLELFITIALHYLRSYYLNSPTSPVTDFDLKTAWKCKMAALDLLTEVMRQLIEMIQENQSRALVAYIHGILQRTKLQKCVLSLLLTSVYNVRTDLVQTAPLSTDILEFNEGHLAPTSQFRDLISTYQGSLLDLTAAVINLELDIKNGFKKFTDQNISNICIDKLSVNYQIYNSPVHRSVLREPHVAMVELRLFLATVMNALKKQPSRHERWHSFMVRILPFLDRSLPTLCIHVVEQLRKNIESAMRASYQSCASDDLPFVVEGRRVSQLVSPNDVPCYPTNYIIGVLETLTTFIHFCLLDSSTQISSPGSTIASAHQPSASLQGSTLSSSLSSSMLNAIPGTKGATELISNLVKAFSFSDSSSVSVSQMKYVDRDGGYWTQAKVEMLNAFPVTLTTICNVWTLVRNGNDPILPIGSASQIRRLILDFLSPIAQNNQQSFLTALAYVWLTRSCSVSGDRLSFFGEPEISFTYSETQMDIARLLLELKVLPFEIFVSTVTDILKECAGKSVKQAPVAVEKGVFAVEASLLEVLHGCVKALPRDTLQNSWSSLQLLFSESPVMNLPPRAIFLEFIILAEFVRFSGSGSLFDDKQEVRAIQDACQKLTEAVNIIIGWQLEQTTWLKRTLVVKHDSGLKSQDASPVFETATNSCSLSSETSSFRGSTASLVPPKLASFDGQSITQVSPTSVPSERKSSPVLRSSIKDSSYSKRDPTFSIQALTLLAENLAELIDAICRSEDKEKLLLTLQAVWNNTLPYLKAKHARNARFFLASSQFLASMSTYNYMRVVWRKSTLDLFLDSTFFKMDMQSLKQWLIIIDNLMTHDKTSFKELLMRISTTPNSALSSLMTSKESEYELRAQALKRLAFTVLSSELDQYQSQLPDIQERLSENIRLSQVPNVHAQVFLCYRVLLLRLKPVHLVSMWPAMVTELVHVLLQIEQQLLGATNLSDDLKCDRNDYWMQLYLSVCKLLETLCTLPSGYLPQYQMCHWAFVAGVGGSCRNSFVPFAERISSLLNNKFGQLTANEKKLNSASLLNVKTLTSFGELRPFFLALATQNESLHISQLNNDKEGQLRDAAFMNGKLSYKNALSRLEHSLHVDFAEHWQL